MGLVQDTPVSTKMISNECMIYHMKVHIFSYNLGPKKFSKSRIHIFPNYGQTDSKTAIVNNNSNVLIIQGVPAQYNFTQYDPGIVRFKIVLNSTNSPIQYGFLPFFSKNSLSKSTFYVLSTSPHLVRFLNSTIPWEPKIRTIRGPPVLHIT